MTRICVVLAAALWLAGVARADAPDAAEIVRRAEDALRGNTAEMKLRMAITTPRWSRELVVRTWDDRPHDRSFVRVLEPEKDKGTAFLRDHDAFWTWLPRVERAMRIPPSMMLQSWMGSDFTNDDLARESSLEKDYVPVLLAGQELEGVPAYQLELRPKPEAPVVWAKVELWIEKARYAPLLYTYYDEPQPGHFEPLRTLRFSDIHEVQGRPLPHAWEMVPMDKPGHSTRVTLEEVKLDQVLADDIFTQSNLRKSEAAR
ncbi:MAG TPA: outer membrane lipoprotein-sorting protein [Myxococcota bacterium]|nr:outer membrane lipoprotein-sorting protein [Myxococcota bacterium]